MLAPGCRPHAGKGTSGCTAHAAERIAGLAMRAPLGGRGRPRLIDQGPHRWASRPQLTQALVDMAPRPTFVISFGITTRGSYLSPLCRKIAT